MILYGYYGYSPSFFYDPTYILIIIAFMLTAFASLKVKTTYAKYAKVKNIAGYTGKNVSEIFIQNNFLIGTKLTSINGTLSDHFDPRSNVVRLSNENYSGNSIAAVAVAAHEFGHVIQYKENYLPIRLRSGMIPVVNIASTLSWPLFFLGIFMSNFRFLVPIGIFMFCFAVAFQIITLPVEIDASMRGMKLLKENNILQHNELKMAKKVLSAAAMTYVAAAMGSIMQLLRLILIAKSYDRD